MNAYEIEKAALGGAYDEEYAYYLMAHSDWRIGNGDTLINAMESGHLWDDFLADLIASHTQATQTV